MSSVAENRGNYTTAEFEQGKRARKLYHVIGAPSLANYKKIIRGNMIKHCPVSGKDVDLAEAIFGEDVPTLQGKTPRSTPKTILQEIITMPPELVRKHSSVTLSMDVMYVNGIGFITLIGYPLYLSLIHI